MIEFDWTTAGCVDAGVTDIGCPMGNLFLGDPRVYRSHLASHLFVSWNSSDHSTNYALYLCHLFHFACTSQDWVDPYSQEISYLLTLYQNSVSQNLCF